MSLELQLSTDKARASIESIDRALGKLREQLNAFSSGTGFETFAQQVRNFQGLPSGASTEFANLARAARDLSGLNITKFADALKAIGAIDVSKTEQAIGRLVLALSRVTVPPGLAGLVTSLNGLGTAGLTAAAGMTAAGRAATSFASSATAAAGSASTLNSAMAAAASNAARAGTSAQGAAAGLSALGSSGNAAATGLGSAGRAAGNAGTAMNNANNSTKQLTGSMTSLSGIAASLGAAFSLQALSGFVAEASKLSSSMQSIRVNVTAMTGSTALGSQALDYLRQTALGLHMPVDELAKSYSKFGFAMQSNGTTVRDTQKMFTDLSMASKGMGLSVEQTGGVMNAFTQIASKGKVQMEELRGQLGDRLPIAMRALATTLGVTVGEVDKLVESGKVGADVLPRFAATLRDMAAKGLAENLASAQGQIDGIISKFKLMQESFGQGLNGTMLPGLRALNSAFADPSVRLFSEAIGAGLGSVVSGFTTLMAGAVQVLAAFRTGLAAIIGDGATSYFIQMATTIGTLAVVYGVLSVAIGFTASMWAGSAAAAAASTIATAASGAAAGLAAAGWAALSFAMTPIGAVLLLLVAGFGYLVYSMGGVVQALQWVALRFLDAADAANALVVMMGGTARSTEALRASVKNMGEGLQNMAKQAGEVVGVMGDKMRSALQATQKATEASNGANLEWSNGASSASSAATTLTAKHDDGAAAAAKYEAETRKMVAAMQAEADAANKAASAQSSLGDARDGAASSGGGGGGGGGGGRIGSGTGSGGKAMLGDYASGGSGEGLGGRQGAGMFDFGGSTLSGGQSMFDGMSGGGISHYGSAQKISASPKAFNGAPRFAGGTDSTNGYMPSLAGGGIPAILHANEAVVPLTGGGSIPIEMTGDKAGDNGVMRRTPTNMTPGGVGGLSDVNQSIQVTTEAVRGGATAIVNELVKLQVGLTDARTILGQILTKASSSASTYSGGGSSSGGSTYPTAPATVATNDAASPAASGPTSSAQLKAASDQQLEAWGYSRRKTPFGTSIMKNGPQPMAGSSARPDFFMGLGADAITMMQEGPEGFKKWKEDEKAAQAAQTKYMQTDPFTGQQLPQYAEGTPNTGSQHVAMVHPDEAIIPLSGGRSVPVEIRGQERSGGGDTIYHVTVNIKTPDVEGFRKSRTQVMQQLQSDLTRATRKIGKKPIVDDPTVRE